VTVAETTNGKSNGVATPLNRAPSRPPVQGLRLTDEERAEMAAAARAGGFATLTDYVRHLHREAQRASEPPTPAGGQAYPSPVPFRTTPHGRLLHGDSRGLLLNDLAPRSVDLIMTSPPFGLVRKKSYGNEDADDYLDWFRPFAEGFRRVLKESGSLVIDIGGAWNRGQPTRSLYHFELLVMLCKDFGFKLCEEHFWWNPAKLPTPAEWVNVRRVRVKDAVNCVWWLSPTGWPKANNRRVLAPYSESMHDLFRNGYTPKLRPSGHDISDKFGRNNGGSVPPNLMALANTESNGTYQEYCRQQGLPIHPARYPIGLPEYFLRFLTDAGDLVVDPFAGSCVTGEAAERLEREWICCELDGAYLQGALARFGATGGGDAVAAPAAKAQRRRAKPYLLHPPGTLEVDEAAAPLVLDGGRTRPRPTAPTPAGAADMVGGGQPPSRPATDTAVGDGGRRATRTPAPPAGVGGEPVALELPLSVGR
jgi:site-specific DNA-methyltransferase (cytosine-N4-specific)